MEDYSYFYTPNNIKTYIDELKLHVDIDNELEFRIWQNYIHEFFVCCYPFLYAELI
jgi:hypothetical protein